MRFTMAAMLGGLLFLPALAADKSAATGEQLEALKKEVKAARTEYCRAFETVKTDKERQERRDNDLPAGPSDAKGSRLKQLLKERLTTLRKLVDQTTRDYQAGRVSFDRVHQAMAAMLRAELELCDSDKERIAVLEKIVDQAKAHEKNAVQRYKAGNAPASDVLMATADRLEAEIALERAKSKVAAHPKRLERPRQDPARKESR
jgi:hypothetical protein